MMRLLPPTGGRSAASRFGAVGASAAGVASMIAGLTLDDAILRALGVGLVAVTAGDVLARAMTRRRVSRGRRPTPSNRR